MGKGKHKKASKKVWAECTCSWHMVVEDGEARLLFLVGGETRFCAAHGEHPMIEVPGGQVLMASQLGAGSATLDGRELRITDYLAPPVHPPLKVQLAPEIAKLIHGGNVGGYSIAKDSGSDVRDGIRGARQLGKPSVEQQLSEVLRTHRVHPRVQLAAGASIQYIRLSWPRRALARAKAASGVAMRGLTQTLVTGPVGTALMDMHQALLRGDTVERARLGRRLTN